MESVLLSLHVVAGILLVGPVAVTASMFPRYVPAGRPGSAPARHDIAPALLLHRITRGYGAAALAVPIFGLVLAVVQERTTELWVVVAMLLTALAGALLSLRIVPMQADLLRAHDSPALVRIRIRMLTGFFNLLWAAVVVLMIVRPGSSPA